ncbi:FlhC family transcriptional regulator (plasmid) [Vibrio sp. SS-MA-C1-2]|uniref:FlhC family transcriptional regulator n=1 Tax=Vibrio sp. SS-MA-C1-2 TaxID=2908646 RepID=UPI001F2E3C13|nr:FlhC family transcriptional regulator [Vibrio sp. SS-MA-C1-2]UJF20208.1 FlhC family transcriptional regulator [Vibrio sp. SS-MA-C1-2]
MKLMCESTKFFVHNQETSLELVRLGASKTTITALFDTCTKVVKNEIVARNRASGKKHTRVTWRVNFLSVSNIHSYKGAALFYLCYLREIGQNEIPSNIDPVSVLHAYKTFLRTFTEERALKHFPVDRAVEILTKVRDNSIKLVQCKNEDCRCSYIVPSELDQTTCPFCRKRNRESDLC